MLTIKEWAAEYRQMNEWEQQERLERLPNEPVAQSVRAYFQLSRLVQRLSGTADEAVELQPIRAKHYLELTRRWRRLARRRAGAFRRTLAKLEKRHNAHQP